MVVNAGGAIHTLFIYILVDWRYVRRWLRWTGGDGNDRWAPAVASDPTLESLHLSLNGWSERSRPDVGMPLRLWVDDVESAISIGALKDRSITSRAGTLAWSPAALGEIFCP
jgi:hypothetical protein